MARKQRVSVLGQFQETCAEHGLLPRGAKVLVAVSGGADSVCLLDLLRAVAPRAGLRLVGFHMNHRLRPAARGDERFVRDLFGSEPFVVVRADVAGYSRRHRLSIEEAARTLRYRHMNRIAGRLGCEWAALGHTADDNLETMLLNLSRGAGLSGLTGIPVRRGIFVRPLIDIERRQVIEYLRGRGLSWVEDETNQDPRFRRNLIRLQVVPALRAVNPAVVSNARRAARLLTEEDEYLEAVVSEALDRVLGAGRRRSFIDCPAFANYNKALKRRMVRRLLPELDSDGIARAVDFLKQGPDATAVLGRNARLVRRDRLACIAHPREKPR